MLPGIMNQAQKAAEKKWYFIKGQSSSWEAKPGARNSRAFVLAKDARLVLEQ